MSKPATVRARSADDLGYPLQVAFENAVNAGAPTLTIEIAPGRYEVESIALLDRRRERSDLEIVIESTGPGPAVLAGTRLHLETRAVTIRNIVIDGAHRPAAPLTLRVARSATLERVAVVESEVNDRKSGDPVVLVTAGFGGEPTALVKDSWIVRNKTSGDGAALTFTADPTLRFASIVLDNVVLAGNDTTASIEPRYGVSTRLERVTIHETALRGPVLHMVSPMTTVAIAGGSIAAVRPVIGYDVNRDVARADYTTVSIARTRLATAQPVPADDATQSEVVAAGAPGDPDWAAVLAEARAAKVPDPARLGL